MVNANVLKLAPTLSAEERYKILIPDMHRQLDGETSLISESERMALTRFEERLPWMEYTRRVCMVRWAQALWPQEIETEKLRIIALYLRLSYTFELALRDGDRPMPKAEREAQFERLKKCAADVGEQSESFYAHREAFETIRAELYGIPLLNHKRMSGILVAYATIDSLIDHFNKLVREVCANGTIRKTLKPFLEDVEPYLIKKPVPAVGSVEEIVGAIRHIASSEMESLLR
jgi:hypothetical protein